MSDALPPGWTSCRLGEILKLNYGKSLPAHTRRSGKFPVFGSNGVVGNHDEALTTGPTIIVGRKGSVGEICFSPIGCWPIDTTYFIDEFSGQDYNFWKYYLQTLRLAELDSSTAIPGINREDVYALEVWLPPLPEQRRIVARIEALFARTRRARADLERIAPLAKRYREQSRRKAFMPDVAPTTSERRIELPEYTPADRFEELPDLPSGWQWAEMGAIGAIAGGLTKNQQRAGLPFEMPYLRVANVYADELRLDAIETLRVTAAEKARVLLQAGDLLIVEGNGSLEQIGRVAVWDGSVPGCGHQNHLIRLRPKHGLPSRFLMHWLMSPFGRGVLEQIASSSSGLHTLSLSKVSRIPVPIPGIASASAIADQLDQVMASSDRAAKDAARALALLDRLEQSILTRAFRGELVPQDPHDEPAKVELERLRSTPATAGRGRSRKQTMPATNASVAPSMKGPAVPKNRADADVKGQPYLANHLRQIGSTATAEDLYNAADLSIADFYKQLSEEVAKGWVKDASGKLEAA